MSQEKLDTLTKRTSRALGWTYAGVATRMLLSIGINILLARLLGPRPFGQLAIAQIIFGFGNLISSVGITSALIQKQNLTSNDIRFCFTAQMSIGAAMSLLLFVSASTWATFFHQPDSTNMLRVFSLLFVLQSFGTTSNALLSRKQDTRSMQISFITSYLIAYVGFGLVLALKGAGVWSLVAAQLGQALINSLISYAMVRHSVLPRLHAEHYHFIKFGARVLGANLSSWTISNADNAIVGRMQGPVPLGLYSRAFNLASMPADAITGSILGILLPPLSRIQEDTQKVRDIYSGTMGLLLIALLPAFAAMATVPGVIIRGLYGQRWIGAVPLFRPLAIAVPINAVMALSGPVLVSRGRPQREFAMQAVTAVVAVTSFIVAARQSLLMLAWIVILVYLLRFALLTRAALQEIHGTWMDVLSAVWPGLFLGAVASSAAFVTHLAVLRCTPAAQLISVAFSTAVVLFAVAAIFHRRLLAPTWNRLPQLAQLVPGNLRKHLLPQPTATNA